MRLARRFRDPKVRRTQRLNDKKRTKMQEATLAVVKALSAKNN